MIAVARTVLPGDGVRRLQAIGSVGALLRKAALPAAKNRPRWRLAQRSPIASNSLSSAWAWQTSSPSTTTFIIQSGGQVIDAGHQAPAQSATVPADSGLRLGAGQLAGREDGFPVEISPTKPRITANQFVNNLVDKSRRLGRHHSVAGSPCLPPMIRRTAVSPTASRSCGSSASMATRLPGPSSSVRLLMPRRRCPSRT